MGGFNEKEIGDLTILPPRESFHKIISIYDTNDEILLEPERSLIQDEKHKVDLISEEDIRVENCEDNSNVENLLLCVTRQYIMLSNT